MSATISIAENVPDNQFDPFDAVWSDATENFQGLELRLDAVWPRIEAYVARRWWSRGIEFVVEGGGEWLPPIVPFTSTSIERWDGGAWVAVSPDATFVGGWCLEDAKYRFTGTVGATTDPSGEHPPGDIQHAVRRLAEFMASSCSADFARGRSEASLSVGGLSLDYKAPPTRDARALIYSGAADLLRPYRTAHVNQ